MRNTILALGLLGFVGLAGCAQQPVNADCALLGVAGGAALGAATDNDIAQSAIAGGLLGAAAGSAGACN